MLRGPGQRLSPSPLTPHFTVLLTPSQAFPCAPCKPSPVLPGVPNTIGAARSHAGQGAATGPHQAHYKKPFLLARSQCCSGQRHGRAWAESGAERGREGPFTYSKAIRLEPPEQL